MNRCRGHKRKDGSYKFCDDFEFKIGDIVSWNGRSRLGDELVIIVIHSNKKTCMICNHAGNTFEVAKSELTPNRKYLS